MNEDRLAARLLAAFVGELKEQVRVMNADLLALEAQPEDAERLRSLFRVAHTVKGAAHAAGVAPVERACHELETRLAAARDGSRPLGPEDFALLFSAADALEEAGGRLGAGRDLQGSPIAALADAMAGIPPAGREPGAGAPESPPRPLPPATGQPATGQPTAGQPAHAQPAHAQPAQGEPPAGEQVRVEEEKLDAMLAATWLLLGAGSRLAERPGELKALHDDAGRWASEWSRASRRIRVALERSGATALARAAGTVQERLQRLAHESGRLAAVAAEDARLLSQVSGEIADRVRRLRMRPFSECCEALPRALRDTAASSGKEADLEIAGGDVQIDRAVLDGLREPLLHLVRNAVDHGIEPPAERERGGKPRRALVRVAAAQRGDRISVSVADDGAGLDTAAIRVRLAERGLQAPADDGEVIGALLHGGVSTAGAVTRTSGRGVGLDIVRAAAERIRGSVTASSEPGRGTTFTLECPPTLATLRALLAGVGAQTVAVPVTHVERVLRVRPEDVRRAEGREVITTGAAPVPLVALARLLPPLVVRPATGGLAVILVILLRAGEQRLAVAVDELLAEQEIVVAPLHGLERLPQVGGASILGSGRVALVLDAAAAIVAGLALGPGQGLWLAEATPGAPARRRILVADDSITTRTLEQSILEAAGYEVLTAVDGAEAWKILQERPCDLLAADVEMPRMDGFALCEAVRASKRLQRIPVVLVTALESQEHRERGLEAGADAYVGKSSFDQRSLLDTIRQLLGS